MDDWVVWMIVAGAMAAGEIATVGFFLGPIAIAALLTSFVAAVGGGLALQLLTFAAVAVASLGVIRPIARRHLHLPAHIRTGTAALVGSRAMVLERVDADGGKVKIGGEVWTARAYDEDRVLEPGERVEVLQIKGATALVSD
jgi:membrane protein implicated in regulation of membrane protease activity